MKTRNSLIAIIFFCLTLYCGNAFAQKKTLTIGPQYTADFYRVKFNPLPGNNAGNYKMYNGHSFGFTARYQAGKRIGFRAGYSTVKRNYGAEYNVPTQPESGVLPMKETNKVKYNEYNLGLELTLMKCHSMRMSLTSSFSFANRSAFRRSTEFNTGNESKTNELASVPKQQVTSVPVSLAMQFKLCPYMRLIVEPNMRFYTSRVEEGITASNPVQYGFAVSMAWTFKKKACKKHPCGR